MPKALCIIFLALAPTVILSTIRAAGSGEFEIKWCRSQLGTVRLHLDALAHHLRAYKQAHGRYPTTDEGLPALDNFVAVEPAYMGPAYKRTDSPWRLWVWQTPWSKHDPDSGWPAYDANSARTYAHDLSLLSSGRAGDDSVPAKYALGHSGTLFLVLPGAVLSPWGVPYVYENRIGHPEAAFDDSPARGGDTDCSARVDDGVYVSSVGAEQLLAQLTAALTWRAIRIIVAFLIGLGAIWALLHLIARRCVWSALAGLLVGAVLCQSRPTFGCYRMQYVGESPFSQRSPAMVARREALLRKHHDAGVISRQTYEKALASMEFAGGSRPTTAPSRPEDAND